MLGIRSPAPTQTQFASQIQPQQPCRPLGLAPVHMRAMNSDFDQQQQGPSLQLPVPLLREDSNRSGYSSASPELKTSLGGGGQHKAKGASPKKRKTVRACNHCQRSHLTCDDSRPCARCIKKNIADTCVDGVRKKAKYLLDAEEQASRAQAAIAAEYPPSHANEPPPPLGLARATGPELNQTSK
ncbi:Transcriptional regulator of nonfermentable carbon utilization [Coemansia sp. BCRC 34962]|nr:Transcriptional regulator of nonfermentable carbon utilization [Coemansia sp. BCRC 34962]